MIGFEEAATRVSDDMTYLLESYSRCHYIRQNRARRSPWGALDVRQVSLPGYCPAAARNCLVSDRSALGRLFDRKPQRRYHPSVLRSTRE